MSGTFLAIPTGHAAKRPTDAFRKTAAAEHTRHTSTGRDITASLREEYIWMSEKMITEKERTKLKENYELKYALQKFQKATTNKEMWETFDTILLILTQTHNTSSVSTVEEAEHEIYEEAEDTTDRTYKAGLLAGAAQMTVAQYRMFPIPKSKCVCVED